MLTAYILVWPVLSGMTLALIVGAFIRDLKQARAAGKSLV